MPNKHMPVVPRRNFRLLEPEARYPHLRNVRITTHERGNDCRGLAIYTDGGTRVESGETLRWVGCTFTILPWKN